MNTVSSSASLSPTQMNNPHAASRVRNLRKHAPSHALLEELESRVLLSAAPAIIGPAAKLVIGVTPTTGFVGSPNAFALEVDVEDANGNIVTTDTSQIKIKINSGPAGALHGTLQAKAVAGVALFTNLVYSKVGVYTIAVSDGALTTATSGTITISAAPTPTTLVFTQQPVGNATGASITPAITVQVVDQYNNPYTKPTSVSLKLLSGPAQAHITGKLSAKTVNGTATFSGIAVSKGGANFVLQAKEGKITMNSNAFAMGGPSVATTLVFLQQPTNTAADAFITPAVTVQVKDQYNNLLTTDHSTVKLTVASGADAKKLFTAPVKLGVATFTKLQYTIVGGYTLQANDGTLTAVVSHSFNITAGVAAGLAFAQIPANGALHSLASTIKVDVVDKFGNTATSNTSTIALAYASAPAGTVPLSLSVAAVAGEASFNALAFPIAGRFELKATDVPFASVDSKSFILI